MGLTDLWDLQYEKQSLLVLRISLVRNFIQEYKETIKTVEDANLKQAYETRELFWPSERDE
jgi:hypothetical protein